MYEKFGDYMWYLLSSPFKMVKKKVNQWYIFFTILGGWFDEVRNDLERALDETTIATCSDILLRYYGEDRGLAKYAGEENDSFRSRIAMCDEVESMGGTREAVLLAVMSLGYDDVEHIWCPVEDKNSDRWAEFIIEVGNAGDNTQPVSYEILKTEVRKVKESTSLDNYRYRNDLDGRAYIGGGLSVINRVKIGDMT